eukprot:2606253-Pleurochrysis_carterae.AAC.1
MSMVMTFAAFAAGSAHTFEGLSAAKIVEDGIEAITKLPKGRAFELAARRNVCSYPILIYAAKATLIIISSQLATHARMANAWRGATDGVYAVGKGLALCRIVSCSVLLAVMALISYTATPPLRIASQA